MAIYDTGTASLTANGQVTGAGTQWAMPLTLIRVGATIVFKTDPVQIYTITEIASDTSLSVYNPNGETAPAGTGYAILAHDGITVQGLAQGVAETLRYYQSRETEVADAVDAFNNFDANDFETKVSQVNSQHGDVVTIGSQVATDAAQVSSDKNAAAASAISASNDKDSAAASAQEAADYAASLDTQNLLRKDLALSDLTDKQLARQNLDVYSKDEVKFKTFSTVSQVTDSSVNDGDVIFIKNISSSADFGGGFFTVKNQRSSTPDGGLVINVGDSSQIFRNDMFKGPVDVKYFGAIPHSSSIDNSIAINLCLASPYVSECYVGDYYLVKNRIIMKSNKSIIGPSTSWAYSDSGFNMSGTIALADDHSLGYLDPILDFRGCRQTAISNIDVDARGADVCCIEYGRRISDNSNSESFNNHLRNNCTFRSARIGLRTDNAGLHRSYGDQITGCVEAGFYSSNNISDSTITSMYINEIGYHSGSDPASLSESIGVGIRLGPHSGVAFIGGKIEYTRIHIHCFGSSYTRFSNMWLDVAKRCAVVFIGDGEGSGTNNFIDNCIITGGGYTSIDGGAVTIDGTYGKIDLTITGGAIVASDEQINPNATTEPTYGAKLAGLKVGNNPNGLVVANGVDMRKCSSQFGIYAYGGSKVTDSSLSLKTNSLSGGSTINGYSYDAGSEYRGLIIRDAGSDTDAASVGVPVGGFYRNNGSNLNIRVS